MKVKVRFFAAVRELVGREQLEVDLPDGSTAAQALGRCQELFPGLEEMARSLVVAVNQEYANPSRPLADGDEVALIPPVSGGENLFQITKDPLSLDRLTLVVGRNTSGAVASFLGIVREFSRGRQVQHLEYEAYPAMAEAELRRIGEEIRREWSVDEIALVHRIGRLQVGEASVAIAISAPHRKAALEACAYAIERIKQVVPIWKKEVWTDGSEWIGSTADWEREKTPAPSRP